MRILIFLLFFLSHTAYASKVSYPPQRLSATGVEDLRITGVKGKLRLKSRPGKTFTIRVQHSRGKPSEDWHLSVDRQGKTLVLEVFNATLGPQWRTQVRDELWPEFDVEITGPSRRGIISWREGDLGVEGWTEPLEISFLKGPFVASGGGKIRLQAVESQVRLSRLKGEFHLQGEAARIEARELEGGIKLDLGSLELKGEKLNGGGAIKASKGKLSLKELKGSWDLSVQEGEVEVARLSGQLKGQGEGASWQVETGPPNEVEIVSATGPVEIRWRGGDHKLFLTSRTGAIKVPASLKVEERDGSRVVESRIERRPRGEVFVRTSSGAIHWRH